MSSPPESAGFDAAQTVVLNALIDLYAPDTIVLDPDSAAQLRSVVEDVTDHGERSAIGESLERISNLEAGATAEIDPGVEQLVVTVADGLADGGYAITVSHEYRQSVTPLDAHVYSFVNTGDVDRLAALDLSPSVEKSLAEGASQLDAESPGEAVACFSTALERSVGQTDEVVSRILAGWGCFRAGDDERALEHVRAALDLEDSSWAARVVGTSVKRDEHDLIRSGMKSAGIVLRWVSTDTAATSTRAELGGRSAGEAVPWSTIDHLEGHAFLDRLYPETWLRFQLRGEPPDFPHLHMYFLGLGVYDHQMDYIDTVIERFGTGPHNEGSVERISIES